MKRLFNFFVKETVTAERSVSEPTCEGDNQPKTAADENNENEIVHDESETESMPAASHIDRDEGEPSSLQQAPTGETNEEAVPEEPPAQSDIEPTAEVKQQSSSAEVCSPDADMVAVTASPEEALSPRGDATNGIGMVSEDLQTTATVSTGTGSGSISSNGVVSGNGLCDVDGSGGGRCSSGGGTDSCSWEPKIKDVKVAENGDTVKTKAKDSGTVRAGKLSRPEVIHPLQNSWGIWCFMQNRSQDWHENVRHISNFSSVEDFWSLFNHIQTVDNLPIGCDYYMFKANIQPMWEDKANVNGGRWLLKVPHSQPSFVQLWIETLLLLVGEAFDVESDSVCGAVAQVRRGFNKISIWTRDAANRNSCMRIGYRWKACLKTAAPIHYEAHLEVNSQKRGRRSKSVYSIN